MSAAENAPRPSVQWLVWTTLGATIVAIVLAFILSEARQGASKQQSGNNGSSALNQLLVITPGLPAFALTNQLGAVITPADLSNHVSVIDVIFTRCAGPCPQMTRRMSELQAAIPRNLPVKLVTVTTDPDYDSVEVLKRYAAKHMADDRRWWFLTGPKSDIARLAREGLKLVAQETDPAERVNDADLFVHSTVFVILDKRGRLRGAVESTEPDFNQRVLQAVRRLAREP